MGCQPRESQQDGEAGGMSRRVKQRKKSRKNRGRYQIVFFDGEEVVHIEEFVPGFNASGKLDAPTQSLLLHALRATKESDIHIKLNWRVG